MKVLRYAAAVAALVVHQALWADDGVTENRILIGQTIGLTGQIAGSVKELNEGAHAYISAVNRRGGVHGRTIEIISLDDRFDPELAGVNARRLISEKGVFALFQNRGTPHTEAILPLLHQHKIPLVAPSTGATILHQPINPYLFNVRTRYRTEVIKAIEQFKTVGITRIALLYVDDSFGADCLAGFDEGMKTFNLMPAGVVKFDRVKPDIGGIAGSVMATSAQTVIIVASAQTAAAIIQNLRDKGSAIQIMTLSNNSSEAFIKSLGNHAPGVIVSQITPPADLLTTKLGQDYRAAARSTGATMSYAAMEGYIAAKVLVEGLERAGRNLTRVGLIEALESIKNHDLGGLALSYGPSDHTGSEYVELSIIGKNSKFRR